MPGLSDIGRSRDVFKPVNSFDVVTRTMGSWAEDVKKNLDKKGKNASSALRQSVRIATKVMGNRVEFSFIMEDYWEWVDKGRPPGKYPPYKEGEAIHEWVRTKASFKSKSGLKSSSKNLRSQTKNLAFLVARKIAKEGTEASHFYSEVVNEKSISDLKNQLQKNLKRDVQVSIISIADEFTRKNK